MSAIVKIASTVIPVIYKHRKAIYAVLTAQDRYISKSFKYGGYGKATSYGVRTGALVGSVAGAFISNTAEDSPGNGVQTTIQPKPTTGKPDKARSGYPERFNSRRFGRRVFDKNCRPTSSRKY